MSKLETSKENIRDKILDIPLEEVIEKLSEQFVQQEGTIKCLYTALACNKNVLLYGKGGFGKSSIVEAFCELFDISTSLITGYEDMPPEGLIGVPNISKLMNECEYEVAFEKSALCTGKVLCVEEFLDIRPETAAVLKDILSRGGLANKNEFVESTVTSVIGCTNKDPNIYKDDTSFSALFLDRFPIQHCVEWESYTDNDYMDLFKVTYDVDTINNNLTEFKVLCTILANSFNEDSLISPRVAIDAADIMLTIDIFSIINIRALNCVKLEHILNEEHKAEERIKDDKILSKIEAFLSDLAVTVSKSKPEDIPHISLTIDQLSEKVCNYECVDSNWERINGIQNTINTLNDRLRSRSNKLYKNDTNEDLEHLFETE